MVIDRRAEAAAVNAIASGSQTARLGEIFAAGRKDNLDFSGIAVIEPQLTLLPQIDTNGMMHMVGFFPSVSTQMNFELAYAPVDRQCRLFGLSVWLGPVAPVPPPSSELSPPASPEASPTSRPSGPVLS